MKILNDKGLPHGAKQYLIWIFTANNFRVFTYVSTNYKNANNLIPDDLELLTL